MPHRIFISYHPADREVADAVVRALEAAGLRCWIAHRDLPLDTPANESITRATRDSHILVLVLTAHAAESEHVLREVQLADATAIPILVFQAESVRPSDALTRFTEGRPSVGWTSPVDVYLPELTSEAYRLEMWRRSEALTRLADIGTVNWHLILLEEQQRPRLRGLLWRWAGRRRPKELRWRLVELLEPLEELLPPLEELRRLAVLQRRDEQLPPLEELRRRGELRRLVELLEPLEELLEPLEELRRLEELRQRQEMVSYLILPLKEMRRREELQLRRHELRQRLEGLLRRRDEQLPPLEDEKDASHLSKLLISSRYPKEVAPQVWHPFYAYIFRQSAARAVEADARERLGKRFDEYRQWAGAARQPVAVGAVITATPTLEGFQFNPPSLSIEVQEDWHRLEFKLRARAKVAGRASNGMLTFTVEGVIVADIPISIYVGERRSSAEMGIAQGRLYRAIFCSYSHRDRRIAERVEAACKALGIDYLRDVITLRSGQCWRQELPDLIERADIFQLFWSRNAARSEHVEHEWRHALGLGRATGFIRPVYWEEPIPQPPAELEPIHFAFVPDLSPWLRRCVSLAFRSVARLVRLFGRR